MSVHRRGTPGLWSLRGKSTFGLWFFLISLQLGEMPQPGMYPRTRQDVRSRRKKLHYGRYASCGHAEGFSCLGDHPLNPPLKPVCKTVVIKIDPCIHNIGLGKCVSSFSSGKHTLRMWRQSSAYPSVWMKFILLS